VRSFDFRKPNKLNRDHVRNLEIGLESFARTLATVLSTTLRAASSVTVDDIEQLGYDDYIELVPNPSHISVLAVPPLSGLVLFQLPIPLVLTAVDLLLGGQGRGIPDERPLTDIEVGLVRPLVTGALRELSQVFGPVSRVEPSIVQYESNPQFVQLAAPTDMMVVVRLGMRIDALDAAATLCIPYQTLEPVLDGFRGPGGRSDRSTEEVERNRHLLADRLQEVPVQVQVVFPPVTLLSADIVDLRVGDVVPLGQPVDAPVWGVVEGKRVLQVRPGRKNKRLAAQVLDVTVGREHERSIRDGSNQDGLNRYGGNAR
jgi:flagellar motor switch protein FliM